MQDHIDVNGLSHLSVRRRGRSITIIDVSGDEDEPRARLTSLQDGTWRLSFPTWNGERWEKTPFAGTVEDMMNMLLEDFGWNVAPR